MAQFSFGSVEGRAGVAVIRRKSSFLRGSHGGRDVVLILFGGFLGGGCVLRLLQFGATTSAYSMVR